MAASEAVRRVRELNSSSEPEVLHKLRVALRRLRTLWWVFQPLLDKRDARFHRSEFKSLAEAAGKTRDWDVLRVLLSTAQSNDSFGPLIERVDRHRSSALAFSVRIIANAGVERIVDHAVQVARNQIGEQVVSMRLNEFATMRAQRAETMLKKRVKRVVSHQDADYAELHEIRIAGKRLRYSLEFLAPVLDDHYAVTIERLAQVQEHLGNLNDLVASETLLREYAFQLGEPHALKKAIKYLDEQQNLQKIVAHDMLRAHF
ncbi:CHAD domain-containing protein [Paraburkholderia metrosideri]|nr:CHAD domain-containing protein [Paraburkholderia metrosideri]